jgi:hypothetical protein
VDIEKAHRYVSLIGPLTPSLVELLILSEAISAAEYEGWPLADSKRAERWASRLQQARLTEEQTHHG